MLEPNVTTVSHRLLGALRRLAIAPGATWDLTQQEASTLAKAMSAVGRDQGRVDEIYLSPQASDGEFVAKVTSEGLIVATAGGECLIGWTEVTALAEALAS